MWSNMILSFCFILLNTTLVFGLNGLSCSSFKELIHSLPYISGPDSSCITSSDCMSVQCTIMNKKNAHSTVGLAIISCDKNPVVVISANIPDLGIKSWSETFTDNVEHTIPGYIFPTSPTVKKERQGYLEAGLKRSSRGDAVILSLSLKGCDQTDCTLPKRIVSNQELSCGSMVKRTARKSTCSIVKLSECGESETCKQLHPTTNEGQCFCLTGFARDVNGSCAPTIDESSITNGTATEAPQPKKDSATVAVNIVVPILILTLVAALVYAAYKHGLIPRLRAHFHRRRFQSIRVGDEDDDDSPLA